jgi:C1A family cysteine protease
MKLRFLIVSIALSLTVFGQAPRGKGLIPLSDKEKDLINNNWNRVEYVHPNKVGSARIQIDHNKRGASAPSFTIAQDETQEFKTPVAARVAVALPSYVNNSLLPSFPPIGDQGQEGSCLAWASTYYQASHEVGLANGRNNKSSKAGILSPKWTYNMVNGGLDQGSMITDAYAVLSQNGAVSIASFPYDGNYLAWDTQGSDWVAALSNRTSKPKFLPGLDGDITSIKQALNNGHVLTFATFIDSWVMTSVGSNPNADPRFVGQLAASWMNGSNGGHMMTIVGYDDNVWIDVNGNGQMDPGELGAFLIANSWSSSWGNSGFVWVSYDAFRATSQVANGPSEGRVPLADGSNSYAILATAKAPNYSPSLIANFQLSQTDRNQIKVAAGASDSTKSSPSRYFMSGALINQGGAYDFAGSMTETAESASFCLDLTDLIPYGNRFYFLLSDNTAGSPTGLESLSLIDLNAGNTIAAMGVPQQVDNGKITLGIDYTVPQAVAATAPASGSMYLSSPTRLHMVRKEVLMTFTTPTPVDSVDFYIDGTLVGHEESAPYCVLVDSTQLTNRMHTFSAVAMTGSGDPVTSAVRARVMNRR